MRRESDSKPRFADMRRSRQLGRYACGALLALGLLIFTGCGAKSNPVSEISVESSGVELMEASVDLSGQWYGWRGPTGDGHAIDQQIPVEWSSTENLRWQVDVPGRGHGSPIIVGGKVLLATSLDNAQEQRVVAYDAETSESLWNTLVHEGGYPSTRETHPKGSHANSTLVSDGERAYITFLHDSKIFVSALSLDVGTEGEIVWQKEIGDFVSQFGFAPSPLLYKSFVIVASDNKGGGYIAALDTKTGEIAWRTARDRKNSHSTPLLTSAGGKDQLVISGCDKIVSYDPATGGELWSTDAIAATTCGTMVELDGKLYASGGYPEKQTICLTLAGDKVWDNKTKIYEPSMVATAGSIFAVSDDGIAYCWDAASGEEQWKKRLGGNFSASPIVCDGRIYAPDLTGKTYVFAASSEQYTELAENSLGSDCYASPAVYNNQLFLRIGTGTGKDRVESLVCLGGGE